MHGQDNAAGLKGNNVMVPHQEQVFLHSNTNMVFVGEYVYYSLYCLKQGTGELSDVSKIAYLKLVNQDREVVLEQKIKLTNGMGDSNFFIPSSIPSGNYKLLAYTQWMLNNGKDYYYSEDITILNPYTSDQAVFRNQNSNDSVATSSTLTDTGRDTSVRNSKLSLALDKSSYAQREQISINIAASTLDGLGQYSLSVRKVDELKTGKKNTAYNYNEVYPAIEKQGEMVLPELRGDLFSGELATTVNDGSSVTLQSVHVGVSFPGEDYLFKLATTDENGNFFVNIEEDYNSEEAYFQVVEGSLGQYKINIKPEVALNFDRLRFTSFSLDKALEPIILERSIYNQIENAYYSSKPDTILIGKANDRFYGPSTLQYALDDYTRFPSMKETFIEVIEHVWIQENKNGKQEFHVRPIPPYVENGELPLVFIDGVLIVDHERLINLSPVQVHSVHISRNQHFYGTKSFQGVVDVTTFKSDYYKTYYSDDLLVHKFLKPKEKKNYFRQSYELDFKENFERLPDFRYQLLWIPRFDLLQKNESVTFFSSDVTGNFEVSLEGFTTSGTPVSLKANFKVN